MDKHTLDYFIHEASTLSRARLPVSQFDRSFIMSVNKHQFPVGKCVLTVFLQRVHLLWYALGVSLRTSYAMSLRVTSFSIERGGDYASQNTGSD